MIKINALVRVFFLGVVLLHAQWVLARNPSTAILVDKKTNQLHVTEYVSGKYKVLKTFHATLGQVKGDKENESDLKTPEGIYTFKALLTPPHLQKKVRCHGILHEFSKCF